jgi:hemolysin activation/secretion protein
MGALFRRLCQAGGLLFLLAPCVAYAAATGPPLPANAEPGRIIEELKPLPEPSLPEAPAVTVSPSPMAQPPPGAGHAVFRFDRAVIEGATAYDPATLEAVFRPFYGQYLSLRKLFELVDAITRRYRHDGYALSQAVLPPQKIADGAVRVLVVEGYIDTVETQGAYREAPAARGIIGRIEGYRPLNMTNLERDLLLLDDLAGVTAHAILKPHPGEAGAPAGAYGLVLAFSDAPPPSTLTLDNQNSRYTGPWEAGFSTGLNHAFGPYQQTLVNGLTAIPSNELQSVQVSHQVPLDSWGTTATLQAAYAHSEPGYRLTPEQIESDSWNYGLSVSHPLIRSRAESLYIGADFTVKDIATDALGSELSRDRLRIVSATASYDLTDGWGGSDLAQLKLSQGLNLPGVTRTGSPNLSRADGHSDFTRLTANAGRLQALTDTLRLYLAAQGQYAWSPLLSSERFGFGGPQFGRAYDPSEIAGDDGLAALAELRYDPPGFMTALRPELFAFYDIGQVWNYGAYGSAESAASAGFGMRFALDGRFSGSLMLAKPLTRKESDPQYGNGKDPRVILSLTARF